MSEPKKKKKKKKKKIADGWCPNREDLTHCCHWWEGEQCCNCFDDTKEDE